MKKFLIMVTITILSILLITVTKFQNKPNTIKSKKMFLAQKQKGRAEYYHRMLRDPNTGKIPAGARTGELNFSKKLKSETNNLRIEAGVFEHEWIELGPNDVGGRTRAIFSDVRNSDILIAGGVSGGIWKTSDGGQTWNAKLSEGSPLSITSISQDPITNDIWYASMGEQNFSGNAPEAYRGSGIYKSIDNGDTWTLMTYNMDTDVSFTKESSITTSIYSGWNNPTLQTTKIIAASVDGSTHLFLCSYWWGIWESTDDGQSFTRYQSSLTNEEDPKYSDIVVDQNDVITLWFGPTESSNGGFWRSYEESFYSVTSGDYPSAAENSRTILAFAPSNPRTVYAFSFLGSLGDDEEVLRLYAYDFEAYDTDPEGEAVIYDRSSNLPLFAESVFDAPETLYTQDGYDMSLGVHPTDSNIVVLGYVSLVKSHDGFATPIVDEPLKYWIGGNESPYRIENETPFGNTHHADQQIMHFDPNNPGVLWTGHDGGISVTQDVGAELVTWTSLNNAYNVTQYYDVSFGRSEDNPIIAGGAQDNGTPYFNSDDYVEGSLLPKIADLSTGDGAFTYIGNDFTYASAQNGALVIHSNDDLGNRSPFIEPLTESEVLFIHPFAVDPNEEGTLFIPHSSEGYVLRNTQFDDALEAGDIELIEINWKEMTLGQAASVTSIKVSDQNPSHRLYVGGKFK